MKTWSVMSEGVRFIAQARGPLLLASAYYLGAQLAFLIGTLSDKIFAPFWPPNVILFCTLMAVPYRRWPLYIAVVFPPHVVAELGVNMGWLQNMVAFVTNCMVAALSAFCLRTLLPVSSSLDSFRSALIYVLVAAVGNPAVCALGGALVRVTEEGDLLNYGLYWQQWYIANALASLTLGAAILAWMHDSDEWAEFREPARLAEALALTISLVLTCIVAFKADPSASRNLQPVLLYAPFPIVLWAAVRFRVKGASAAILLVTIVSIAETLHGPTVFMHATAEDNVLALQLFLSALAVPVLLLAASVAGLRRAEHTTATLTGILLGAQDDERRYVANRLHEHIAQNIVAATWIAQHIQKLLPPKEQPVAQELEGTLHRATRDVRSLSYLLHPPLLEEGGVSVALRALVDECVTKRGIVVNLDIGEDVGRLPPRMELAIFRLVEDALASIDNSSATRIRISKEAKDAGKSMLLTVGLDNTTPVHSLRQKLRAMTGRTPVGSLALVRMRERLRSIGGSLDIHPTPGDLRLQVTIPIVE
jgi:integral membrane sensor domain MASE1